MTPYQLLVTRHFLMKICHEHNLRQQLPEKRPYGIRVRLPAGDPFTRLLGPDWEKYHWYETEQARDLALVELGKRHAYSRVGDLPTLELEKVDR